MTCSTIMVFLSLMIIIQLLLLAIKNDNEKKKSNSKTSFVISLNSEKGSSLWQVNANIAELWLVRLPQTGSAGL